MFVYQLPYKIKFNHYYTPGKSFSFISVSLESQNMRTSRELHILNIHKVINSMSKFSDLIIKSTSFPPDKTFIYIHH